MLCGRDSPQPQLGPTCPGMGPGASRSAPAPQAGLPSCLAFIAHVGNSPTDEAGSEVSSSCQQTATLDLPLDCTWPPAALFGNSGCPESPLESTRRRIRGWNGDRSQLGASRQQGCSLPTGSGHRLPTCGSGESSAGSEGSHLLMRFRQHPGPAEPRDEAAQGSVPFLSFLRCVLAVRQDLALTCGCPVPSMLPLAAVRPPQPRESCPRKCSGFLLQAVFSSLAEVLFGHTEEPSLAWLPLAMTSAFVFKGLAGGHVPDACLSKGQGHRAELLHTPLPRGPPVRPSHSSAPKPPMAPGALWQRSPRVGALGCYLARPHMAPAPCRPSHPTPRAPHSENPLWSVGCPSWVPAAPRPLPAQRPSPHVVPSSP